MTVEEMKRRKQMLGLTNEMLAERSGVPLGTVQKIMAGVTQHPRYDTLTALERTLSQSETSTLREAQPAYGVKEQGEYTLEDYYALPDDDRVELIDGVFYDMAAPTSIHQIMVTAIWKQFSDYIEAHHGTCLPMISPLDVQLDRDERTMVQPDVLIVCDTSKVIVRCVYGAPDLVVEILSPGTRRKDMIIKLNKYMNAGVKEYWMVDPDQKQVMVYDFDHERYAVTYDFDAKVPVGLYDGDCQVDFRKIYDYMSFLYERED